MYAIMLRMMLLTHRTGFGVVQWIFTPTHLFATTITYLVVGVQTFCLDRHYVYNVSNMYNKFWNCRVDVQAATMMYDNPRDNLVVCVHT